MVAEGPGNVALVGNIVKQHFANTLNYPSQMAVSPDIARRLTGEQEMRLLAAQSRVDAADKLREQAYADRDALIAELVDANYRAADIADVLGRTRNAVYLARERARGR